MAAGDLGVQADQAQSVKVERVVVGFFGRRFAEVALAESGAMIVIAEHDVHGRADQRRAFVEDRADVGVVRCVSFMRQVARDEHEVRRDVRVAEVEERLLDLLGKLELGEGALGARRVHVRVGQVDEFHAFHLQSASLVFEK
ncbi:hypothetical protein OMP40_07805 [Cohnella rhizosphaerae]|uniref:Uncharacterized protein n=1 Tax=Cohnella rhizosphaerae TaxID=1457232 RepID=A0A9X4QSG7_9BACL|nr:hypothetical protein [Cohnella rhizosphaerae]MDG0809294.1 hypothetical protein [Cohnella rhizosphaerae]